MGSHGLGAGVGSVQGMAKPGGHRDRGATADRTTTVQGGHPLFQMPRGKTSGTVSRCASMQNLLQRRGRPSIKFSPGRETSAGRNLVDR